MDGLYEQLRIALHSVWRQRWWALGVAWGVCLLGWLVLSLIPNSYEAKARLYVQSQALLPSSTGGLVNGKNDLVMLRQTLVSSNSLEKVVRRTDLNSLVANDADLAAQVAALRLSIKVVAQPDDVFEVTATSSVPGFSNAQNARTAAGTVQALIDAFVEENSAGDRAQAGQTLGFIDEELKRREVELREAEQRRVDFETKFMGLLPGEGSITQRLGAARTELSSIEQQLLAAQGALASARSQIAGTPPTIAGADGMAGGAVGQLSALEGQLAQLRARGWKDTHPDIVATLQQIARVRPQAQAERRSGVVTGTPNPLYVSLRGMLAEREAQASALAARKNQLASDLAQLNQKQAAEPELVAEQARLSRDYDVLKTQYDKLLEDREQIRLRSDVNSKTDQMKFRVIDRPSIPSAPAKPNRPLFLTLILFVAIGAGIGAAFAKSQLQPTFPTLSRLEQVSGLQVLGSISEVVTGAGEALARQRLKLFAGVGGALGIAWLLLMAVEFYQRSTVA